MHTVYRASAFEFEGVGIDPPGVTRGQLFGSRAKNRRGSTRATLSAIQTLLRIALAWKGGVLLPRSIQRQMGLRGMWFRKL